MIRGQKKLYTDMFPVAASEGEKGKRNTYLQARDEALSCRYYYYARLQRLRYEDCINNLSNEFYLTSNVIIGRILTQNEFIKSLDDNNISINILRKKYPHFNWLPAAQALTQRTLWQTN